MNDDLCNLRPLEAKGEWSDGQARVRFVRPWQALHVLSPDSLLSKTSTSLTRDSSSSREMAKQMTETTIQLKLTHDKPLPDLLISVLEQRAYDYCAARSVRADVDGKVWYELKVRDAA
jgi:hypothetical protein